MEFFQEALTLAPDFKNAKQQLAPLGWDLQGMYFVDQDNNPIDGKTARKTLSQQSWYSSPSSDLDYKRKAAVRFAQRWNRMIQSFTQKLLSGNLSKSTSKGGGYKTVLKEGVKVLRGVAGKFLTGLGPIGALANQIIPDDPLGALGY